jgi:hypothetical protein
MKGLAVLNFVSHTAMGTTAILAMEFFVSVTDLQEVFDVSKK